MKTEKDDVSLNKNEFYDDTIRDSEFMKEFLEKYDDIEKVKLYKYVLRRAKTLSNDKEEDQEMISYCWLASMELEHTDAIKRYLNKEISEEDIAAYDAQKEAEIQQIIDLLEERKRNKSLTARELYKLQQLINRLKRLVGQFVNKITNSECFKKLSKK
jgi:transcriptional regulator with GAF, ATPase, and Fis domain